MSSHTLLGRVAVLVCVLTLLRVATSHHHRVAAKWFHQSVQHDFNPLRRVVPTKYRQELKSDPSVHLSNFGAGPCSEGKVLDVNNKCRTVLSTPRTFPWKPHLTNKPRPRNSRLPNIQRYRDNSNSVRTS